MNRNLPKTLHLTPSILFWCNLFTVIARLKGVSYTIRLIQCIASRLPLQSGSLTMYSDKVDALIKTFSFLFVTRKQICLIRGLLLFFIGKRLNLNVHLHFGSKLENQLFNTHCWISQDGQTIFEVDEIIQQYTTLVEYA